MTPGRTSPAALAAALGDPYDRLLAESILGTADAALISQELGVFCRARLGAELADVPFCELSVGAGLGLALAARGFPAPGVLVPPRRFMAGRAAVHEWLDRGAESNANEPPTRRAMAAGLARLVELATPFRALGR